MPEFSIVVPIYNVEGYLKKCLDSILNQTFVDYEIILVNDGSTDQSLSIIKEYMSKYPDIKLINQENKGLSEARNSGLKEARGNYVLFVDSDDFIDKDLLLNLNDSIINNPDLVRFQLRVVSDKTIDINEEAFDSLNGHDAFKKIIKYRFVENAWAYLYSRKYLIDNGFLFKPNMYHEDYGLIPLAIIKASKVNSISYIGYNYVQRSNSIMSDSNYMKTRKKAFDVLSQYLDIVDKDSDPYYRSFLANSVILKLKDLNKEDYKKYLSEIKKHNVFDNILSDTLVRKIKKMLLKISPKLYLKVVM
ncbi:MAG: glycosyltransferase [Bacilli bacterium]|nr:glycosyltransferase [Bacilli bacterium]